MEARGVISIWSWCVQPGKYSDEDSAVGGHQGESADEPTVTFCELPIHRYRGCRGKTIQRKGPREKTRQRGEEREREGGMI